MEVLGTSMKSKTVPNMSTYSPDYLFRTVIGVLGCHPDISHCAKDLQNG